MRCAAARRRADAGAAAHTAPAAAPRVARPPSSSPTTTASSSAGSLTESCTPRTSGCCRAASPLEPRVDPGGAAAAARARRAALRPAEAGVAPRGILLVEQPATDGVGAAVRPGARANRLRAGLSGPRGARRGRCRTSLSRRVPRGVKRVVVGRPMASGQMEETLLPKWLALPIFASDPLSSVAYATEAALVVLVAASATPRTSCSRSRSRSPRCS